MSVDAIRPKILRLHGLPPAPAIDVAEAPAAPAGLSAYFGMSRRRFRTLLGGLLALFVLLVLWRNIFIPIGSGNAGVLWSRFGGGTVMDRRYDEGEHAIWPWDQMTVYDLRLQEMHGAVPLLTSDGLQVSMRVTVRYAPRPNALTVLHRDVGPGYRATVVWPDMVAAARHIVRQFKPEDLSVVGEAELAARVEAAARSAWTTVKAGAAGHALTGLSPVFERVTVNGRALTRLKVAAPTTAAVAICRAAQVNDPWCARQA